MGLGFLTINWVLKTRPSKMPLGSLQSSHSALGAVTYLCRWMKPVVLPKLSPTPLKINAQGHTWELRAPSPLNSRGGCRKWLNSHTN